MHLYNMAYRKGQTYQGGEKTERMGCVSLVGSRLPKREPERIKAGWRVERSVRPGGGRRELRKDTYKKLSPAQNHQRMRIGRISQMGT